MAQVHEAINLNSVFLLQFTNFELITSSLGHQENKKEKTELYDLVV